MRAVRRRKDGWERGLNGGLLGFMGLGFHGLRFGFDFGSSWSGISPKKEAVVWKNM